jgi:hypothetical protein
MLFMSVTGYTYSCQYRQALEVGDDVWWMRMDSYWGEIGNRRYPPNNVEEAISGASALIVGPSSTIPGFRMQRYVGQQSYEQQPVTVKRPWVAATRGTSVRYATFPSLFFWPLYGWTTTINSNVLGANVPYGSTMNVAGQNLVFKDPTMDLLIYLKRFPAYVPTHRVPYEDTGTAQAIFVPVGETIIQVIPVAGRKKLSLTINIPAWLGANPCTMRIGGVPHLNTQPDVGFSIGEDFQIAPTAPGVVTLTPAASKWQTTLDVDTFSFVNIYAVKGDARLWNFVWTAFDS